MHELDDGALELRLRHVLTDRLGSLPLDLTAEELERRRGAQVRDRGRRRPLILLGLAAALLVPVGWLAAGGPLPAPALLVSDASPSPNAMVGPSFGDYQVIEIRRIERNPAVPSDVDVVAIRADGQERVIARLAAESMPTGFVVGSTAYASRDGWLAIGERGSQRLVLIDLQHPAEPVGTVQGSVDQPNVAWGPDGRLAVRGEQGITVVDPASGVTTTVAADVATSFLRSSYERGTDAPLTWAADGSGFVTASRVQVRLTEQGRSPDWQKLDLATGDIEPGFVPVFDLGADAHGRSVAGDRLALCPPRLNDLGRCRGAVGWELGRQDVSGTLLIWDVTPGVGTPEDVIFAANDRGMWILRADAAGGQYVLDRLDEQGAVVRTVTAAKPDWWPDIRLGGMAPDDSLARIVKTTGDPDIIDWFLLPTNGAAGTYHRGSFAGYLASTVADALGGDEFRAAAEADGPTVPKIPSLPSESQLDAWAAERSGFAAADSVLLRADGPGKSGGQATIDLGSITQLKGHRIGIQFACAGPASIGVDFAEQSYGIDCMQDDQSWGFFDPVAGSPEDRILPVTLSVENGAAWRVAVYDLGP